MPDSTFTLPSADGTALAGYRWDPAGEPVGAVALIHGMGEHIRRYEEVADALRRAGLVVYGYDHRGHGASAAEGRELGDLGPGGWSALVDDIGLVVAKIREDVPGLPLVLVAHSMGSFATQQFLLDNSDRVDGVALSGTAALDLLEPALNLDEPLDLSAFNEPFQPARTGFEWLSRDESRVDAYVADPLCGFGIDEESARAMFAGARRLADPVETAKLRASLPLYLAVGSADPLNAGLALLNGLADRLRGAGVEDLTVRVYDGARHEIFNETNRDEVVAELVEWVGRVVAAVVHT